MMIPVRCFTCGSLIADKYEEYKKRVDAGEDSGKVLDELGVKRYCCRRMFVSNVDVVDQILPYEESVTRKGKEYQTVK
ncbi:MAG: DNA-directed RNA polymerase subunit N [Nitrososphaeria archaeon]|jgi:DNA-directed RNA polymerase subunit N